MFNPLIKLQDRRHAAALQAKAAALESELPPSNPTPTISGSPTLGKNERFLLSGFSGVLKAGEMALVLGRPGAGCTTFLKTVANLREGVAGMYYPFEVSESNTDLCKCSGVDGNVIYGDMSAEEAKKVLHTLKFIFIA